MPIFERRSHNWMSYGAFMARINTSVALTGHHRLPAPRGISAILSFLPKLSINSANARHSSIDYTQLVTHCQLHRPAGHLVISPAVGFYFIYFITK